MEDYAAAARKIHRDLPIEVQPRVQEVMLDNLKDQQLRNMLWMNIGLQEREPSFATVCNMVAKASKVYQRDNQSSASSSKVVKDRPSREEEDQMRVYKMMSDTMVSQILTAVQKLQLAPATTPQLTQARATYPPQLPEPRPRGAREHNPCYNCWDKGHFAGDCPKAYPALSRSEKRVLWEAYADRERSAGREPTPMPVSLERRQGNSYEPQIPAAPKPIGAAAFVEELDTSADEDGHLAALVDAGEADPIAATRVVTRIRSTHPRTPILNSVEGPQACWIAGEDDEDVAYKGDSEDEVMAGTGEKRTHFEAGVDTDPEQTNARKTVRKTKRAPNAKQPYRHVRMMENAQEFDIVEFFRRKRITVEDNVTWGMWLDKSPEQTSTLLKSLVRPTRRHKFAPIPIPAEPMRTTRSQVNPNPQTFTTQLATEGNDLQRISNCYVTSVLSVPSQVSGAQKTQRFEIQRTLLDGGSTMDFINDAVAREIGLEITPTKSQRLRVADGHVVDVIGRYVGRLTLEKTVTRDVTLYIMQGETPYAILLGIPALHAFGAAADFGSKPATYIVRNDAGFKVKLT